MNLGKPSVVQLDQIAQAAALGVTLSEQERTLLSATMVSSTIDPGTMGRMPAEPGWGGT